MRVASGHLIEDGLLAEACGQILGAQERTDGVFPPDLAAGVAAEDLVTLIAELRTTLGCE